MEVFTFVGSVIACVLGISKIIEMTRNRAILKISASGGYEYLNSDTKFGFTLSIENVGRRPAYANKFLIDLLDKKKKRLNIHSTIKQLNCIIKEADFYNNTFNHTVSQKLPEDVYYLQLTFLLGGKKYRRRIEMISYDHLGSEVHKEIEDGRRKGLID